MHTKVDSFWYPLRDASYRRDILLEDLDRIAAFYRDHGHRAVRLKLLTVERLNGGKQVAIRIGITEGPVTKVSAVTFGGVQTVKRESAADVVETKVGEPYSATRVTLDRLRLLELYADRGRPFTTIQDSVVFDSTQAQVHFQITEGSGVRIRNIAIEGAAETKPFVIRRELKMKKGDLLRRSQVVESRERLLETGFFRDVRFQPVPLDSVPPVRWLDLKVSVVERPSGWVSTGVGFSSSEELRLSTEVGQRNIFGNAQRLVGRGRVAFDTGDLFAQRSAFEEARVDLAFFEPWLFSTRTQGTITLFGQSDLEPELPTATVTRITREDAAGFELAAERRLYQIRGGRMRFRGAFENRWVRQEIDLGTEGASEPDSVPKFVNRSVSFFVERDRRDNPFDPGRGSHADFLAQAARSRWRRRSACSPGLHPERIDLGLGRAPGTDPMTMFALQRDRRQAAPDNFTEQLPELLGLLEDRLPPDHPFARHARTLPGLPERPEPWLLGSSPQSAIWAAELGLPYSFADFINPAGAAIAADYRARFVDSERLGAPRLSVCVIAVCAESDDEAQRARVLGPHDDVDAQAGPADPDPAGRPGAALPGHP